MATPKKTIRSGLAVAQDGDVVVIKGGHYMEDLNIAGRDVSVVIDGSVNMVGSLPVSYPTPISGVSTNKE